MRDRLQLTTTGELIAYARKYELTTVPMLVIKRGRLRVDRPQVEALTQELTATQLEEKDYGNDRQTRGTTE